MGNASGPTRISKECSAVLHPTIRVHGANSPLGYNMLVNSLPVAASDMSPFEYSVGYKPPLFPSQEPDAVVPSTLAFVQHCLRNLEKVGGVLVQTSGRTKAATDRCRSSPPAYVCGQRLWLSKDLPLRAPFRKLAPRFIGPHRVTKVINLVVIRLKLPPAIGRVHPVFNVSGVKCVFSSPLYPAGDRPTPHPLILWMSPLPIRLGDYSTSCAAAEGFSISWTGRVMVQKRAAGCRPGTFWTVR